MKKIFRKVSVFLTATILVAACKPNLDPIEVGTKGKIDLSKYVAVGNSLTAGFADGGLYNDAIANSYPNFIAEQFKLVGGGEFNQPFFDEAQKNGSGYLAITGWAPTGTPNITPVTTELAITSPSPLRFARFSGSNNNLGIPGIRAVDVTVPIYSQLNPYFERLLPPLTSKSYVDFTGEANPTFFTCWIGNNDVLGYATNGGTATGVDISGGFPISATGALNTITAPPLFNASYDALINKLTANDAKGAVATIPDVATIPFVTTVNRAVAQGAGGSFPRVTFPLPNGVTAAQANAFYVLNGYSNPDFTTGSNNFFVISIDNPATPVIEVRQMNPAKDFFLLSAQAALSNPTTGLAAGLGVLKPNPAFNPSNPIGPGNTPAIPNEIPDGAVLDMTEVNEIRTSTAAFNAKIKSVAQIKGLAIVDADAIFKQIITNNGIDGVSVNTAFISGGLFSLDGVHLTPKGYAIVANQFVKAINAQYQVKIPLIDINARNFRGVLFP